MGKKGIKTKNQDEDYFIYTETHRRRRSTKKNIAFGPWTVKQNEIYLNFLSTNRQLFETQFVRRSSKVFRKMSSLLRRRDPEQCRSHHQKLVLRCDGKVQNIIDRLQTKIKNAQERKEKKRSMVEEKGKKMMVAKTGDRSQIYDGQVKISYGKQVDIDISINLSWVAVW